MSDKAPNPALPVLHTVPIEDGGRCSGHCRRKFTLPMSPEEIEQHYRNWCKWNRQNLHLRMYMSLPTALAEAIEQVKQSPKPETMWPDEIQFIYPMLKYLGKSKPAKDEVVHLNPTMLATKHHFYTCKHLDDESGNCTMYEHRPRMCRDYPYMAGSTMRDAGCNYSKCTWKGERRRKPILPDQYQALLDSGISEDNMVLNYEKVEPGTARHKWLFQPEDDEPTLGKLDPIDLG